MCGEGPVAQAAVLAGIQFKGTGWYITDYAKKSGTDAGKTGSGEKSDGGPNSASESKSDSKQTRRKSDSGAAPAAASSSTPARGDQERSPIDAALPSRSHLFQIDRQQVVAEGLGKVRAPQREVHDRLQESELVAGVVADAVDPAAVNRA